jgi:hypothetical protein
MRFLSRVLIKALLLFTAVNLLVGLFAGARLGQVSAYNGLFPGRPRFPFGETPREAYNFSLFDLDAMFAAHEVSAPRTSDEFRVFVLGDSSVWGTLLRPQETLAGQLNALHLSASDGRQMRFYNLGYPTLSLTKDLLLLDMARQYQPDMVIWLVTLEAFPRESQTTVPLASNNPARINDLLARFGLESAPLEPPDFWGQTLVGRRKELADLVRLQLYGVLWAGTGIDQTYPLDYPRAQLDFDPDRTFHEKISLAPDDLAFDVLAAGQRVLEGVPLIIVNEPILISSGKSNEIRYNFYYPRWAYDQYRLWMETAAREAGYAYLDAWDIIPSEEFTNSAIHINREGMARLAERLKEEVQRMNQSVVEHE